MHPRQRDAAHHITNAILHNVMAPWTQFLMRCVGDEIDSMVRGPTSAFLQNVTEGADLSGCA